MVEFFTNKKSFEDDCLEALEKLTNVLESLERRVTAIEKSVKDYRKDDINELKEELRHRSRYMETVFENILNKDFTSSGTSTLQDKYSRMRTSNGRMIGPVGKLP